MTTLASTDPQVTRPGWVRCLGGWRRDFGEGWNGYVMPSIGRCGTWEILHYPGYRLELDQVVQTNGHYETPDDAAEACERAREVV